VIYKFDTMSKTLILTLSLFSALTCFCQKINYTNNRLFSSIEYRYNVIGKINDKVLVWQANANKHFESSILVYDNEMNFLHAINTNIFQSPAEPQPRFLITGNSFKAIYRHQKSDLLLYMLAGFDENGNLISVKALDSININNNASQQAEYGYMILQSTNKKTMCFIKIAYDKNNYALKLNCSYIDDTIINKDFAFSIDVTKKMLTAINIDNDKNLLFLFEENAGSSTTLKVIKKNYAGDLMLVVNKTVKTSGFQDQSVHITQNPNGYIIYGELNDNNNLFVWQTDTKLNNIAGDTILNKQLSGAWSFIPSGNSMANTFMAWNTNTYAADAAERTGADPQKVRIPNYSNDLTYIPRYNNLTPDEIATSRNYEERLSEESVRRQKDNYSTLQKGGNQYFPEVSLKHIELFKIDSSNKIAWTKFITDGNENNTRSNLLNSKISFC